MNAFYGRARLRHRRFRSRASLKWRPGAITAAPAHAEAASFGTNKTIFRANTWVCHYPNLAFAFFLLPFYFYFLLQQNGQTHGFAPTIPPSTAARSCGSSSGLCHAPISKSSAFFLLTSYFSKTGKHMGLPLPEPGFCLLTSYFNLHPAS